MITKQSKWHCVRHAITLSRARQAGAAAYAARLAELEELSAAKATELQAPGQVLLKFAAKASASAWHAEWHARR